MKRFHLIFGVLTVIAFVLTGQYMDKVHHHLIAMADGPRLLYRSRHIFILLSGLLNLMIGAYFISAAKLWRRILQWLGSTLIVLATLLFVAGFFIEPTLANLHTPYTHWAADLIVASVLCHLIAASSQSRINVQQTTSS